MRYIKSIMITAPMLCMLGASAQVSVQRMDSPDRIEGRYIVTLAKEHHLRTTVSDIKSRTRGKVIAEYDKAIHGFAIELSDAALKELQYDPRVVAIEADQVVYMNQVQVNPPWGLDRIDQRNDMLDQRYNFTRDGAGAHIYVIDTGLRVTHTDFTGRVGNGFSFIGGNANIADCNGHGTHVAGTAAGTEFGVAKEATVHPVRVFNCTGTTTNAIIVDAIDWVVENRQDPAIINMSLGSPVSDMVDDATNAAVADGVFVAVAAGNNNGANACTRSPARAATAMTVGSTTNTDARSGFSNIGPCVDIFAPGTGIESAWWTNNTATNTLNGTSMASPHVAGIAALILGDNPAATPAQVTNMILARATPDVLTGIGAGSPDLLAYSLDEVPGAGPPTIDRFFKEFIQCQNYQARYVLDWVASSGSNATQYDLDYSFNGTTWYNMYTGPQIYAVRYLSQNTYYRFRVRARNADGWGPFKNKNFRTANCSSGPIW